VSQMTGSTMNAYACVFVCVCLRIVVSNTYCLVLSNTYVFVLFHFSSSCVPNVASYSGLSFFLFLLLYFLIFIYNVFYLFDGV